MVDNAAMNRGLMISLGDNDFASLRGTPRRGMISSQGSSVSDLLSDLQIALTGVCLPMKGARRDSFLSNALHPFSPVFWVMVISTAMRCLFPSALVRISLMITDVSIFSSICWPAVGLL